MNITEVKQEIRTWLDANHPGTHTNLQMQFAGSETTNRVWKLVLGDAKGALNSRAWMNKAYILIGTDRYGKELRTVLRYGSLCKTSRDIEAVRDALVERLSTFIEPEPAK